MAIQHWEPFREMITLREAVNSLLQDSFVRPGIMEGDGNAVMLPLDITENENEFVVKASLPGVRPEDVQITARGDTLTIRGEMKAEEEKKDDRYHLRERRIGQFQRTVVLPTPINADGAQAQFENGVLTLTLPKAEEAKPKQIRLAAATAGAAQQGSQSPQASQVSKPQASQISK